MNKVFFVFFDDWEGLYVNGELQRERSSLEAFDCLIAVKDVGPFELESKYYQGEDLLPEGKLPEKLSDLQETMALQKMNKDRLSECGDTYGS